jgi:RNA polymerase sigma-70 factor (ECF subfamily)
MTQPQDVTRIAEPDQRWRAWMAAAQSGDRQAYAALLNDCVPFIKAVARRQGAPVDALDDIVQETLLTVHRARQTYDPSRPFTAWLRTITQRRAIDFLRSSGRKTQREQHAPIAYENYADTAPDPQGHLGHAGDVVLLNRAIAQLPASQRQAIEHLAMREQTLSEAAAATGRSTGALKVNLHRAVKTLRTLLAGMQ